MSKEALKSLDREAERLLFTGAQAARLDPALEAARAKLAPLGPKAPAIAKVVEQVEKVQQAAPKAAAAELLNLAALMMQVRGAQAAPLAAPEGELVPLPRTEPMGSPLSSVEFTTLVGALTGAEEARHRARIIKEVVERGAFRDLRLLPFCVGALQDSVINGVVESELLPRLGGAVVPELRASLKLPGRVLDARKLRVLARIEGKAAQPLLTEATQRGSPEVRAAALSALAGLDMEAAEPIALKLLAEDRAGDVKRAAVGVLAGCRADAALDALFKTFLEHPELREATRAAIAQIQHPQAPGRALALLTPELLALKPFKAPRAVTKPQQAAREKAEQEHNARIELLDAVLDLLSAWEEKDCREALLRVFREHKLTQVSEAAALSLLLSGDESSFDECVSILLNTYVSVQERFIEKIITREPARAFEKLGRFLDGVAIKTEKQAQLAGTICSQIKLGLESDEDAKGSSIFVSDPRWIDAVIALLDHPDLTSEALDALFLVRPPKALEPVLKLKTRTDSREAHYRAEFLACYEPKDARIAPLLPGFLDLEDFSWDPDFRSMLLKAIREYDDPALVPALKAWLRRKKRLPKSEQEEVARLVRFLERDR